MESKFGYNNSNERSSGGYESMQGQKKSMMDTLCLYAGKCMKDCEKSGIKQILDTAVYSFAISAYLSGDVRKGLTGGALGVGAKIISILTRPIFINAYVIIGKDSTISSIFSGVEIMANVAIARLAASILLRHRGNMKTEVINILKDTVATLALKIALVSFTGKHKNELPIYLSV